MSDNIKQQMLTIGQQAKQAYQVLAIADTELKNKGLITAAQLIRDNQADIIAANKLDMQFGRDKGLTPALLDRLELNQQRIEAIAKGLEDVAQLPDPVNKILASWDRPNGLKISRVTVPLGVIGVIYESRPNVTADAAGLCLKSGNAVILRGGSESFNSSTALVKTMHDALNQVGLPTACIQLVPTRDRAAVGEMLTMVDYIDIIVPRGGKGLTERVQEQSKIPTIQHLDGNCHTYIHASADVEKAVSVVYNAKMRRTGICGATESLVVDKTIAPIILPKLLDKLSDVDCVAKGEQEAIDIDNRIQQVNEDDWGTEYLDKVISIKLCDSLNQAVTHVNKYSSGHTEAIIAEDKNAAVEFIRQVDSAIVMHNTSTQFADGGEFGMGAEIGISTGRLHARGPVGVDQLVTYKYAVYGDGQVRN